MIDLQKMNHIEGSIVQLFIRQGPRQPIRACLVFRQADTEIVLDQSLVSQRKSNAKHSTGNLGIVNRCRRDPQFVLKYFHVL